MIKTITSKYLVPKFDKKQFSYGLIGGALAAIAMTAMTEKACAYETTDETTDYGLIAKQINPAIYSRSFKDELNRHYAGLAAAEGRRGVAVLKQHFDTKAKNGVTVPEAPELWGLIDDDINNARTLLEKILNSDAPLKYPADTAAAQVRYDCWVTRQSLSDIGGAGACRSFFEKSTAALVVKGLNLKQTSVSSLTSPVSGPMAAAALFTQQAKEPGTEADMQKGTAVADKTKDIQTPYSHGQNQGDSQERGYSGLEKTVKMDPIILVDDTYKDPVGKMASNDTALVVDDMSRQLDLMEAFQETPKENQPQGQTSSAGADVADKSYIKDVANEILALALPKRKRAIKQLDMNEQDKNLVFKEVFGKYPAIISGNMPISGTIVRPSTTAEATKWLAGGLRDVNTKISVEAKLKKMTHDKAKSQLHFN